MPPDGPPPVPVPPRPHSCGPCRYATPSNMPNNYLGYVAWHAEAARRHRAGQRQQYCLACGRFRWPDELAACPDAEPGGQHPFGE